MPTSPILAASEAYLKQLERSGSAASKRLIAQYATALARLQRQVDRLEQQLRESVDGTLAQLYRLDRYQALIEQVADEMGRLGSQLAQVAHTAAVNAASVGATSGINVGRLAAGRGPIGDAFMLLDRATIERASAFVNPQSPLYRRLVRDYSRAWAEVIAQQYVSGIAQGWNPRRIKAAILRTLTTAVPAHIETTIRTAQLWTYHSTQQAVWQTSGLVDYWTWHAALGQPRTCASCIAKHGSRHPVSEVLRDHHNGRCAQVPHVVGTPAQNIPSGESVFAAYSQQQQMALASAAGWLPQWRAWQAGAIKFSDLSQAHDDDVYGPMFTQASLKSLLGEQAAQYYERNQ